MLAALVRQTKALRRFLGDTRGVNAIEFALAAPVLITLYFGTMEISDRLMADRKSTSLASTAADLAAQDTEITNAEMADILAATAAILLPMNPNNAAIRITSIVADADGKTTVAWSDAWNTSPRATGSTISVPNNLVAPNSSVILAETTFTHQSATGFIIQGTRTVSDRFYLRPRRTEQITRVN